MGFTVRDMSANRNYHQQLFEVTMWLAVQRGLWAPFRWKVALNHLPVWGTWGWGGVAVCFCRLREMCLCFLSGRPAPAVLLQPSGSFSLGSEGSLP